MIGMILMARYLIEEHVGSGGMSDVYRGLDLNTDRKVAIKILKSEFSRDDEFRRRFHREAHAAAALSHENLVGVHDLGHEGDLDFIVMEYVHGQTLKDRIREKGALPIEEVVRFGCELCSALDHAHAEHIIHRDIKPQNIIINEMDEIKLTDFGIARATTSATVTVTDGSVMGSVHYFSPEQARGELAIEQSDLYSLGVVLFEMTTGKVPFEGDSPVTIALQHLQEPPPALDDPGIPAALSKIIAKALKKDILDRYGSASEMYADLARVCSEPDGDFVTERLIEPDDPTRLVPIVKLGVPAQQTEQEPEEEWTPPRSKHGSLLAFLLIVVVFIGLIWFSVRAFTVLTDDQTLAVPLVEMMTEEKAREVLAELEYIPSITTEYSFEVGEGLVIWQSPAAQTRLKKHSVVTIAVSIGPEFVTVPPVVGISKDVASNTLKSLSLTVELVGVPDSDRPRGQVIRQEPGAGFELENGGTVIVYFSDPPVMRRTPEVVKMALEDAENEVEEAGLAVGKVVEFETTEMDEGIVIRQSPEADVEVVEGSEIDLYVSIKPREAFITKEFTTPTLDLPDGDCQVRIEIQDQNGIKTILFNEMTAGGEFTQTLMLEEKAGTYRITAYVDDEYWDSWNVEFK